MTGIYDVAVVGGGRAGAAAARVLAAEGLNTVLLNRPARHRIGESLIPDARKLLRELGVWERFQSDGHLPCFGNQARWGSSDVEGTDFIRSPYGHGWHLDGASFDRCLRGGAEATGAVVWPDTAFRSLERGDSGAWHLSLDHHGAASTIRARFVVDATGRAHSVARRLGVRRQYADRLLAFQTRFRADPSAGTDPDATSFVEAVPDGWWYTARVPAGDACERAVIMFTDADSDVLRQIRSRDGFLALLRSAPAVSSRLNEYSYVPTDGPVSADARSSHLERLFGAAWLAIGDAGIAFDPLSSQGIFTALYAGLRGARAVLAHLGGDRTALSSLSDELLGVYAHFRENQKQIYGLERRWPQRRFWRVRGGRSLDARSRDP